MKIKHWLQTAISISSGTLVEEYHCKKPTSLVLQSWMRTRSSPCTYMTKNLDKLAMIIEAIPLLLLFFFFTSVSIKFGFQRPGNIQDTRNPCTKTKSLRGKYKIEPELSHQGHSWALRMMFQIALRNSDNTESFLDYMYIHTYIFLKFLYINIKIKII